MKQLAIRNNQNLAQDDDVVSLVMATVPLVMGVFRGEMRANRPAGLSVPQFRALIFIHKRAEGSISGLSEHMGLAPSTASKLVDGLVKRDFVMRTAADDDRRRVVLTLTESGSTTLEDARSQARAKLEEHLSALSPDEEDAVVVAMSALHRMFRG